MGVSIWFTLSLCTRLCPPRGRVFARTWADCNQFRRVELRVSELLGVSVISQVCDDEFGTLSRRFPTQSQIHASVSVKNRHVSKPLDACLMTQNNHFNHK
jgi:hypothetical protein